MKDADLEIIRDAVSLLREHMPLREYDRYAAVLDFYERMKAKNEQQKMRYQNKAEYHRENTRKWRQDNKEKHYAYQKNYRDKKTPKKSKLTRANRLRKFLMPHSRKITPETTVPVACPENLIITGSIANISKGGMFTILVSIPPFAVSANNQRNQREI